MKKVLFGCIVLMLCTVSGAVFAEGMADFPPLPESGRGHFAIYREASRENRIELAMFDIAEHVDEDGRILVWNNALSLGAENGYLNDIKYYLAGDCWVPFEQNYTKISDNVGELLYSDLNYVRIYSIPEVCRTGTFIKGDDGYYFCKKERSEDNRKRYDFYYVSDRMNYEWIGSVKQPEHSGMISYPNEPVLGRLNGELVCVFEPQTGMPRYYMSVGHTEGPLVIYGLDDKYKKSYQPDQSSAIVDYNWEEECFYVTFQVITENAPPDGAHTTLPDFYLDEYKTWDFSKFEQVPSKWRRWYDDIIEKVLDKQTYEILFYSSYQLNNIPKATASRFSEYQLVLKTGEVYPIRYETYDTMDYADSIMVRQNTYSTDGVYFKEYPASVSMNFDTNTWLEGNLLCVTDDTYIYKTPIQYDSHVFVCLDDTVLGFTQPPVVENGRILVPLRFLFEQMGAQVDWEESSQTVSVQMNGMIIRLQIDCPTALVNGEQVTMDVPARLIGDKMMVPLRFLSERLGCQVVWDEVNCMAAVYTPEVKEMHESIK